MQRQVQLRTNSPAQYFFNFEDNQAVKSILHDFMSKTIKDAGVVGNVKLVTIPQDKSKMILRLENIGDNFLKGAETQTVSLIKILKAFHASGSDITEVTLTGNMPINEMWDRKIQWKTMDDNKPGFKKVKTDKSQDWNAIKLENQRIRTFVISSNEAESFLS